MKNSQSAAALVAAVCLFGAAGAALAQGASPPSAASSASASPQAEPHGPTPVKHDVPPALAAKAKISLEAARKTALAAVPGGVVKSEELEREHGRLIYSFDIAMPGKPGVEEVNVSARTGKIVAKHHETPRVEIKEQAKEQTPQKPPPR